MVNWRRNPRRYRHTVILFCRVMIMLFIKDHFSTSVVAETYFIFLTVSWTPPLTPFTIVIYAIVYKMSQPQWTQSPPVASGGFVQASVGCSPQLARECALLFWGAWGQVSSCQSRGWVGPVMRVACCCCSWWGGEEGQRYLPGFPACPPSHLSYADRLWAE